jgi:hypothetical protein
MPEAMIEVAMSGSALMGCAPSRLYQRLAW